MSAITSSTQATNEATATGATLPSSSAPKTIPAPNGTCRHYFSENYSATHNGTQWIVTERLAGEGRAIIPPPLSSDIKALDDIRAAQKEEYVLTEAQTLKKAELEKKLNIQKVEAVSMAVLAPQSKA